ERVLRIAYVPAGRPLALATAAAASFKSCGTPASSASVAGVKVASSASSFELKSEKADDRSWLYWVSCAFCVGLRLAPLRTNESYWRVRRGSCLASRPRLSRLSYSALTRRKSFGMGGIVAYAADSLGGHFLWSATEVSFDMLLVMTPKIVRTLFSRCPAFSPASIVFSQVGAAGLFAIASYSRRCSSLPT